MGNLDREHFNVTEEEIGDYSSKDCWIIKGETYKFIEDYPSIDCDGECHNVVTQRESDGKYFEFSWILTRSENYNYDERWSEVHKKEVVTIEWICI